MGERKGQNKYYPPDFDPKKHKSLNAYHGVHALRERARKLDQGVLIIRFEMPYNIWCEGCKAHIAMGVRYNAEKKKVGMYFSTPIYEFRMKCHLCDQYFDIRTDPKNLDYIIISGAKRKEQRWDMSENEQIVTNEKSDIKRLSIDPMFSLEHEDNDKSKLIKLMPTLKEIESYKSDWKDDYALNSMLRSNLRQEKKSINDQKESDKKFLDKWNINIDLVRENEEDLKLASLYKFNTITQNNSENLNKSEKRKLIENESIFNNGLNKNKIEIVNKTHNNKEDLKKKIKNSNEHKLISSSGFNRNNLDFKNNLTKPLLIVKKNFQEKKELNNTCTIHKLKTLVANEYGSNSEED